MFLQPVTKFFIGSFLEGMDGPLGYRQLDSDFSILFSLHGQLNNFTHLYRYSSDRFPHQKISFLPDNLIFEIRFRFCQSFFDKMFIDLFASDHIEATIPGNPIKVSFYFKDILKVGPILPIGQQGFLSNVFPIDSR